MSENTALVLLAYKYAESTCSESGPGWYWQDKLMLLKSEQELAEEYERLKKENQQYFDDPAYKDIRVYTLTPRELPAPVPVKEQRECEICLTLVYAPEVYCSDCAEWAKDS